MHHLLYGGGLQTWEYSPDFALRSYAYILPHAVVGGLGGFVGGLFGENGGAGMIPFSPSAPSLAEELAVDKRWAFYSVRIFLAVVSAYCEGRLCTGVSSLFGSSTARLLSLSLIFSPGLFISSTALLPDTFCMYAATLALAEWFHAEGLSKGHRDGDKGSGSLLSLSAVPFSAIMAGAAATLLGKPFVSLLFIPLSLSHLVKNGFVNTLVRAVGVVTMFVVPSVLIDYYYYEKSVLALWNITKYNALEGDDELYGIEPWTFYLVNLFLNFNIQVLLALAMPLFAVVAYYLHSLEVEVADTNAAASSSKPAPVIDGLNPPPSRRRSVSGGGRSEEVAQSMPPAFKVVVMHPLRLCVLYLSPLYGWLALLTTRPHKEERFLFPVYPLLSLASAIAVVQLYALFHGSLRSSKQRSTPRGPREYTAMFTTFCIGVLVVILSVSRISSLVQNFGAPLRAFSALNSDLHTRLLRGDDLPSDGVLDICVGKEWYRFGSSFFLPSVDHSRFRFVEAGFHGQLPQPYSNPGGGGRGTSVQLPHFNGNNKEELTRYFAPLSNCEYMVDFLEDSQLPEFWEDRFEGGGPLVESGFKWETLYSADFLVASKSRSPFRAFYIPLLSAKYNVYGSYVVAKKVDGSCSEEAVETEGKDIEE
jgi:alpha-1,2-mannosyltransferase